jgi:hypothetical protein
MSQASTTRLFRTAYENRENALARPKPATNAIRERCDSGWFRWYSRKFVVRCVFSPIRSGFANGKRSAIAGWLNPMRVVNQAVEDAVGYRGIADLFVPLGDRNLRGEDHRTGLISTRESRPSRLRKLPSARAAARSRNKDDARVYSVLRRSPKSRGARFPSAAPWPSHPQSAHST